MFKRRLKDLPEDNQQAKKTKNNPTNLTLDITTIYSWTREEILLLLHAPISPERGANISWRDLEKFKMIKPSHLNHVVYELQTATQKQAIDTLVKAYKDPVVCLGVVSWVKREFCTTWKHSDFMRELKKRSNIDVSDIKMFDSEDYDFNWIQQLLDDQEVKWPTDVKPNVRQYIENWLKSLRYFTIKENETLPIFISGVPFSERIEQANETFGVLKKSIWGNRAPPFVNRNDAILETIKCLDTFIVNPNSKPNIPIISTSMGMGKTSFLLTAAKKFLHDPSLIYKYIFMKDPGDELSWDMLKELISKQRINCPRVEFVNRLYRSINSGHFIAVEPVTAQNGDSPSKLLEDEIILYMDKMFVNTILRMEKNGQPIFIGSLKEIFGEDKSMVHRLKKFSEIIKWNSPNNNQLLLPTGRFDTTNDELPLLLFLDSFHLMNFDTSKKGSLHNTCAMIASWKKDIPGLSLILATNSLPNQFISEDKTLFLFKRINLDLLIGIDVFGEIIYDLYGVFLNMKVLKEYCEDTKIESPQNKEPSPYLTRVLISLLYMCSGNGRAIERLYINCNGSIQSLVEEELSIDYSERMKLTHVAKYDIVWQNCKHVVTEFANSYPEHFYTDSNTESLFNLTKIMGLNVKPDYKIGETSIEDLQKIGLFVKFGVDEENGKCKYGGSFMMLHNKGLVNELKPISPVKSRHYTHIEIQYEWLLQPNNCITTLSTRKHDNYFDLTIASSIWARYCIACLERRQKFGSSIPITTVLPSCMIPSLYDGATISLRGVVKLCEQFQEDYLINALPKDRVIINMTNTKFCNVILPIKLKNETKFIGFQTNFCLKKEESQLSPWWFIDNAKTVLSFDDFAYVVVYPELSNKILATFPSQETTNESFKELVKLKERIKFASCEDLVSVWWYELKCSQSTKRK